MRPASGKAQGTSRTRKRNLEVMPAKLVKKPLCQNPHLGIRPQSHPVKGHGGRNALSDLHFQRSSQGLDSFRHVKSRGTSPKPLLRDSLNPSRFCDPIFRATAPKKGQRLLICRWGFILWAYLVSGAASEEGFQRKKPRGRPMLPWCFRNYSSSCFFLPGFIRCE